MVSDNAYRACDADRERVVEVLRDAYATGRLTLEEFEERATAAFTARTWGDLRRLTADLPVVASIGPLPVSIRRTPWSSGAPPAGKMPIPVLPIAALWLITMLAMHSPGVLIPILFLLLVALPAAAKWRADPGDGRPPRPAPGQSRRRAGGPA